MRQIVVALPVRLAQTQDQAHAMKRRDFLNLLGLAATANIYLPLSAWNPASEDIPAGWHRWPDGTTIQWGTSDKDGKATFQRVMLHTRMIQAANTDFGAPVSILSFSNAGMTLSAPFANWIVIGATP